jgi:two-component system, cell cycle sensor histidine kinase and response regulator CckA
MPSKVRNSIRKKLTWMNMLVSGAAVLMAAAVFVAYGLIAFRETMARNLPIYEGLVAGALLISMLTAFGLSSMFHATAQRIMRLAETAWNVAREKKYSVRAPGDGDGDEIAILGEAFNEMLAQIQERDSALQQTNERLNLVLRSSRMGAWSCVIGEDMLVWDDYMCILFGLQPGGFSGKYGDFLRLVYPNDRERVRSLSADAVRHIGSYDIEFRVIWPNGSIHSLSARGKIYRNGAGRPVRMAGVCWDISERKRTEEERQKFVSLVEQTDDFVGMSDLDGKMIYINRAGSKLVGLDGQNIAGTPLGELFPEEWSRKMRDEILPSIGRGEGDWTGEAQLCRRANKQPIDVLMNVFPVNHPDTGQLLCFATVMRDITSRKHLEEQLRQSQRLDSLGQLAGGVAHDFNNLLTIISGYSEMIREELDSDHSLREPVEEISLAAERATALTRQLLAFSRRQAGERKEFVLNDLVRNLEKMLKRLIGEDIDLVLYLDEDSGSLVADPGHIEQVIVNLVVNARDAMPAGGRLLIETSRLRVDEEFSHMHMAMPPGDHVLLAVSDTGIGMTPEVKARVFEPFFTTKEKGKGTGLGLSTVYGIVRQSGGSIWVYSEPRRGSVFKMLFPAAKAAEQQPQAELASPPRHGHETILLVEDETGVRKYIRRILERHGYNVLEAPNGILAMSVAREHPGEIDLLLTDVVMPDCGGVELANQFVLAEPGVPVVYMSGYNDRIWLREGLDVNFLQKPFAPGALLTRLRGILDPPAEAQDSLPRA